ncbi:MAG TPA: type II toxin-antitoxin system RelE/ParE family toxin [Thermoanaerobaculia bacterium]
MRSIFFEEDAKAELRQSAKYYDRQKPGLGSEFTVEISTVLDYIGRHPFASPSVRGGFRRTRVKRFPFDVIYAVEEERIVVVAVMHHRRHPDYWKDRI